MSDTSPPAVQAAPDAPAPARTGRGSLLAALVLVVVSIGLYAPTLSHPLVYDDYFLIGQNAAITPAAKSFGAAFSLFGKEYWEGVNPGQAESLRTRGQALYRPLTLFAWACVVAVQHAATPTWTFHLLNLLVNAAVVLLLWAVIRRFWNAPRTAFVAALLFALHPLHSEAVAYIAGLSDLLAAAAVLAGLLLWERATRAPGHLHMPAFAGLMAAWFVGLLAKEQTAVLLPAILLTDVMFVMRGENRRGWPRLAVYVGLLLLLALHLGIRTAAIGDLRPSAEAISVLDNPLIREGFGIRLINGVKLLVFQLWLFLWPAVLSIDYSFNALPTSRSWGQAEPLAAGVLVALLLVYGLVMLRRRPALGWGVLFFLGVAGFTSNILVPIGTLFGERLTYLPTAGLCLAVAAALDGLLRDRRAGASPGALSALGLVLLLGVGGLLGSRTWERNRDFSSKERLFESAAEAVPESARVHFQLGALLGNQQLYTKAEEHYTRALQIHDTFVQAAIGLGDVYLLSKNWQKAIEVYDRILGQLSTTRNETTEMVAELSRMVYSKRANARAGKGDTDGAAADLRSAMQIAGDVDEASVLPYLQFAQLSMDRGKPADAVPVLRQALTLNPQNVEILYSLARAATLTQDEAAYEQAVSGLEQTERGKPLALDMRAQVLFEQADAADDQAGRDKAMAMFDEVRRLRPERPMPWLYRGRVLGDAGRYAEAIIELDQALTRAPRFPMALRFKAIAQNRSGHAKEALDTERELELIAPDADCYALMFQSHFELGDLDGMERAAARLKELGVAPTGVLLDLSVRLAQAGRHDDAIDAIESGLMLASSKDDPSLLFNLAVLLIEAGRFEEALAVLDREEAAERAVPEGEPHPFLPINRARALMGLDRDAEAAAQLEIFEHDVVPESVAWVSLAHRRAELFLKRHSPYFNPQQASELLDRALVIVKQRDPELFDRSIEALAAQRDFPAAARRAGEAVAQFPQVKRFEVAARGLQQAADGKLPQADETLRRLKDPALDRIAAQIATQPGG